MTTPLTDQERAEMKRKAEAATPGPWEISRDVDGKPYEILGLFNGTLLDPVVKCQWASATKRGENDYAFIAAANPAAVLALLAEIEELRGKQRTDAP